MPRAQQIRFTGTFPHRDEAAESLKFTGDAGLVRRGVARMLLLKCPCGCGDILLLNLDKRAGPAWRMYERARAISLFPSYWRDSKCRSHFIIWNNSIHWCDWEDQDIWTSACGIQDRVFGALTEDFVTYERLAEKLGEIPWDVLVACNALVQKGEAIANEPRSRGEFRRAKRSLNRDHFSAAQ